MSSIPQPSYHCGVHPDGCSCMLVTESTRLSPHAVALARSLSSSTSSLYRGQLRPRSLVFPARDCRQRRHPCPCPLLVDSLALPRPHETTGNNGATPMEFSELRERRRKGQGPVFLSMLILMCNMVFCAAYSSGVAPFDPV